MRTFIRDGIIIAALLLIAAPASAFKSDVPAINMDRISIISGLIAQGNLDIIGNRMLSLVQKDATKPVQLIINSPGGDVVSGRMFISYMERVKSQGVDIECFVPQAAASMAFSLLTHCTRRYALSHSFLLWHRVRAIYVGTITAPAAAEMAADLAKLDEEVIQELTTTLQVEESAIMFHLEHETLHLATDLELMDPDFISVYPVIPGLLEALGDPKILRNPQPKNIFGQSKQVHYIYIYEGPTAN